MKDIIEAIGSLLGFIVGGILILALGLIITVFMPGLIWVAVSFLILVGVVAIFTKDD